MSVISCGNHDHSGKGLLESVPSICVLKWQWKVLVHAASAFYGGIRKEGWEQVLPGLVELAS